MCNENKSYNQWAESDAGKSATNPETLGVKKENEQFLRNRIWKAYDAGHRAGRENERKNIMAKLEAWLSA